MKHAFPMTTTVALLAGVMTVACAQGTPGQNGATDKAQSSASTDAADTASELDQVRDRVTKVIPDLPRENVRATQVDGLYEVQKGNLFGYVTADGKYLIEGDLIDLNTGISLTEQTRKADRLAKLDALGLDNMIVFAPSDPAKDKYHITVFTDVDCGYCRMLHHNIGKYNDLGIEVRYVFYPRTGPDSESFRKAEQVWCSDDRKAALTEAKQGKALSAKATCDNPVQREWELGGDFGLRGTPMIVLPDGGIVNGYVAPEPLAKRLAELAKS